MKTCTQTNALGNIFDPEKVIDILADAGYDAIDWSFFEMLDGKGIWCQDEWRERAIEIRTKADSRGIPIVQAHAPFPSEVGEEQRDKEIFERITRSMEIASILGVKNIVVHPVTYMDYITDRQKSWDVNMDFFSRLVPFCEKYGICVCAENMKKYNRTFHRFERRFCGEPDDFCEFIDRMHTPWIRACLDIGHAALVGVDPAYFIRTLGADRLHALHIHDVDLLDDLHTLPFTEKLEWESICQALGEIRYEGWITLEADNFIRKMPQALWPDAIRLMSSTARYLADRVETYKQETSDEDKK